MEKHKLVNGDKKIIVAVSGGVDSLALLYLLHNLNLNIEILHFNHQTRGEDNALDEELILKYARLFKVNLNTVTLKFSLLDKNFESQARLARNKVYKDYIKKGYWVYTAHHLDDSFEWTLMQSFKQGSLKSTLGIPVFNNGIVRPFMCVSKKQIIRYAHAGGILWREDSSNKNTKFERNFLRSEITADILDRYPKSLRHYVARQNELARLFNLHRLSETKSETTDLVQKRDSGGSVLLISSDFSLHKSLVKDWIHFFSKNHRGEIDAELEKLLQAQSLLMEDPKEFPFKGPMDFSGGVKIFLMKDHLYIMNEIHYEFYRQLDMKLKAYLSKRAQIPELAYFSSFPYLLAGKGPKLRKTSKFIHPLLKETCLWLKGAQIPYTFTPLIGTEVRQKIIQGAVVLDSSVLGL
jgi:tRNA(Ile)-lysidine synthase